MTNSKIIGKYDLTNSMQKQRRLLSIGEASEYLNVSIDTLRRWEKRGKIESLRSPGNHRYFSIEDLDKLFGKKYQHDSIRETSNHKPKVPDKKDNNVEETIETDEVQRETLLKTPSYAPIVYPTYEPPKDKDVRIIDRPAREVKIPKVELIRVIRTKEELEYAHNKTQETTVLKTQNEQVSTSILTPASLEKKESQKDQKVKEVKEKDKETVSKDIKKIKIIKNNLIIYATFVLLFLLIIAVVFFLIGVSSQEILSPIP